MRLFFAALMLAASTPALAIINIEELRMDESVAGFSMSSTLSFSGQRGRIDEDEFGLDAATQWVTEDLQRRYLLLFNTSLDRADGITYSEEYFAHLRRTQQINNDWGWEIFTQYQHEPLNDEFRRELAGTNARYRLEESIFNGFAGAGIMYERRMSQPASVEQRIQRNDWRFNFYMNSTYPLSENAEWGVSFYVQPKIDDLSDVRSIVNLGLTSRITRLFSLTLDLSYSNETEPLTGQAYSHWEYATGLNIRF